MSPKKKVDNLSIFSDAMIYLKLIVANAVNQLRKNEVRIVREDVHQLKIEPTKIRFMDKLYPYSIFTVSNICCNETTH